MVPFEVKKGNATMKFILCIILTLLPYVDAHKKRILIFGGNGFLGSHLVKGLADSGEDYEITLVNRGNVYFNSDKDATSYADKILICDRDTLLRSSCPGLLGKSKYDVVIDFSSYKDQQIEQVIDILKNRVGIYIMISTDAVYEVSEKHHSERTREEDSKNEPEDLKKREELVKNNKYGAAKKGCEERLMVQRERLGFPYVILRLADAIGERDTSYRWWNYQLWMNLHQHFNHKVALPNGVKDHKFSMVYAGDVAKAIMKIIHEPEVFHDKVINLAYKKDITLTKILDFMQKYYKLDKVSYEHEDEKGFFRYPTAERGPIDVTNAEILLDWEPTPFEEAAKATCEFFDEAMVNPIYAKEREIALAEFIEETLPESFDDEDMFIYVLTKLYSSAVFNGIDIGLGEIDSDNLLTETNNEDEDEDIKDLKEEL
ncbi:dTDP-D-glucose 4,6-dehydratase-like [Clytia hemisphaerica]